MKRADFSIAVLFACNNQGAYAMSGGVSMASLSALYSRKEQPQKSTEACQEHMRLLFPLVIEITTSTCMGFVWVLQTTSLVLP